MALNISTDTQPYSLAETIRVGGRDGSVEGLTWVNLELPSELIIVVVAT